MKEDILKLIESDITGYKIHKETGISESTISRIRSGKIELGSISLDNATKLHAFYKKHKEEI
ncbi:helix-turn-helix domain-containing protein [Gracilibacillus dipsosauri]|uniref:helix-turn-helix domain-containing protein n=1 Tax=Gracilibacillus dipsosauri TaxID=178340 RepID=UPI001FEA1E38|nr:helix-turn-helix domain-containing protein [Gracilibacillus dipsosauri]